MKKHTYFEYFIEKSSYYEIFLSTFAFQIIKTSKNNGKKQ